MYYTKLIEMHEYSVIHNARYTCTSIRTKNRPSYINVQDNSCTVCKNWLHIKTEQDTTDRTCKQDCPCRSRSELEHHRYQYIYTCNHCISQSCWNCNEVSTQYHNGLYYCDSCHDLYGDNVDEYLKTNPDPSTDTIRYRMMIDSEIKLPEWILKENKCNYCSKWTDPREDIFMYNTNYYCSKQCSVDQFVEKNPDPSTSKYIYQLDTDITLYRWIYHKVPCLNCHSRTEVNNRRNRDNTLIIDIPDQYTPVYCSDRCEARHVKMNRSEYITLGPKAYRRVNRIWEPRLINTCMLCHKVFYTEHTKPTICYSCGDGTTYSNSDTAHIRVVKTPNGIRISQIWYFVNKRHTWGHPNNIGVSAEQFDYKCQCGKTCR